MQSEKTTKQGPEKFKELLAEWKLDQYTDAFEKGEWTNPMDWSIFVGEESKDFEEILNDLIPKKPYALKFKHMVRKWLLQTLQQGGEKTEEGVERGEEEEEEKKEERETTHKFAGGPYWIMSVSSKRFLDVEGDSQNDCTPIIEWSHHGKENQQFVIEPKKDEKECYYVKCVNSGKYWDINGANKDNGAILIQYSHHGNSNQCFYFNLLENGTFEIIAKHS